MAEKRKPGVKGSRNKATREKHDADMAKAGAEPAEE